MTKNLLYEGNKQLEKLIVKEYNLSPFIYNIFPFEKERFCIIIVSQKNDSMCKNLLQYILNSFIDEEIVDNCVDLNQLKRVFESGDSHKLAIIDISPDNRFEGIHQNIISYDKNLYTNWNRNYNILRVIFPNILRTQFIQKDITHKSHTIWLASSIQDIPNCLYTHRNIMFIIDQNQISYLFNNKLHVRKPVVVNNSILCVDMLAKRDIQFSTINKLKFSE